MSWESWLEEFYPTPADSEEALLHPIKHGLRKWTGFLPENAQRHKAGMLFLSALGFLHFGDAFTKNLRKRMRVTDYSCALCQKYCRTCCNCPLSEVGAGSCYGYGGSPYDIATSYLDPKVMIAALKTALDNDPWEMLEEVP